MYQLLHQITAYLEYLNSVCGLSTTVHFSEERLCWFSENAFAMLLPYNVHKNPYCTLVKKKNWTRCTQAQKRVIQKKCGGDGFCGTCYAGVCEYDYPIRADGKPVGFIAVSGYRRPDGRSRCVNEAAWEKYLSPSDIPRSLCDAVIPPLGRMFELLFTYPKEDESGDDYNLILQYIHDRNGQVTLEELCRHFNRSKSYISHMFNEKSGKNLRTYCNEVKLEYARKLITATEAPITEIALDAGYNDMSYFIVLFKEKYGLTPLKYRKK